MKPTVRRMTYPITYYDVKTEYVDERLEAHEGIVNFTLRHLHSQA